MLAESQNELMWGPKTITTGASYNTPLPPYTPNVPYAQYYGGYANQQKIQELPNWQNDFPAFKAAADYSFTVDEETFGDWFVPSLR